MEEYDDDRDVDGVAFDFDKTDDGTVKIVGIFQGEEDEGISLPEVGEWLNAFLGNAFEDPLVRRVLIVTENETAASVLAEAGFVKSGEGYELLRRAFIGVRRDARKALPRRLQRKKQFGISEPKFLTQRGYVVHRRYTPEFSRSWARKPNLTDRGAPFSTLKAAQLALDADLEVVRSLEEKGDDPDAEPGWEPILFFPVELRVNRVSDLTVTAQAFTDMEIDGQEKTPGSRYEWRIRMRTVLIRRAVERRKFVVRRREKNLATGKEIGVVIIGSYDMDHVAREAVVRSIGKTASLHRSLYKSRVWEVPSGRGAKKIRVKSPTEPFVREFSWTVSEENVVVYTPPRTRGSSRD